MVGSDFSFVEHRYTWTEYLRLPWLSHHVLALHAAGGIGWSESRRRGLFALAGVQFVSPIDAIMEEVRAPSVALRGFAPFSRVGNQFHLFNAEYRFPLLNVGRGLYTFPVSLRRFFGLVFADFGDAFFGTPRIADWNLGVGAELLVECTVGYFIPLTFRLGIAEGITERGITDYWLTVGETF